MLQLLYLKEGNAAAKGRNIQKTCESFSPLSSDAAGCPFSPEEETLSRKGIGMEGTGGIRMWVLFNMGVWNRRG